MKKYKDSPFKPENQFAIRETSKASNLFLINGFAQEIKNLCEAQQEGGREIYQLDWLQLTIAPWALQDLKETGKLDNNRNSAKNLSSLMLSTEPAIVFLG